MINLNNILVKCSAALLAACIQTSGLLAMDSDDKENNSGSMGNCLNHGPIVMTVGEQTKAFFSMDKAHDWFHGMVRHQKAERLVEKANQSTVRKNAAKKNS